MAEHHHDHSNCSHDHHNDNAKKVSDAVNGELTARQKATEKLNKVIKTGRLLKLMKRI